MLCFDRSVSTEQCWLSVARSSRAENKLRWKQSSVPSQLPSLLSVTFPQPFLSLLSHSNICWLYQHIFLWKQTIWQNITQCSAGTWQDIFVLDTMWSTFCPFIFSLLSVPPCLGRSRDGLNEFLKYLFLSLPPISKNRETSRIELIYWIILVKNHINWLALLLWQGQWLSKISLYKIDMS